MSSKRRLPNARVYVSLSLILLGAPRAAVAQENLLSASPIADAALAATSTLTMPEVGQGDVDAVPRPRVLVPLYVLYATLQALDAQSTIHALNNGAREKNPVMRGIASQPAVLIGVKAGMAASTILLAEQIRLRSRTGAIVFMAAMNSLYATVVSMNYATIASMR